MAPPGRRSAATVNSVATTTATTATRKSLRNSSVSPTPRDQTQQQQQQVSESNATMKKKPSAPKKKKQLDVIVGKKEKEEKVIDDDADDEEEEDLAKEGEINNEENDDDDDDDDVPLIRHKDVILKKKAKCSATTSNSTATASSKSASNTSTNEGLPQRRSKRAAATNTPAPTATTRKAKGVKKANATKSSVDEMDNHDHDSMLDGEDEDTDQNDISASSVLAASNNSQKTKRKTIGGSKAKTGDDGNDPLEISISSRSSSLSMSTQKPPPPQAQRRFTRRSSTPMSNTSINLVKSHQDPTVSLTNDKEQEANNVDEDSEKHIETDTTTSQANLTTKEDPLEKMLPPSQQQQREERPVPSIAMGSTTSIIISTPNVAGNEKEEMESPINNDLLITPTDLHPKANVLVAPNVSTEPTTTTTRSVQNDPVIEDDDIKDTTPSLLGTTEIVTESVPSEVTATVLSETSPEQVQSTIEDVENKTVTSTLEVLSPDPTVNDDTTLGSPNNDMDVDIPIDTNTESIDKKAQADNEVTIPIATNKIYSPTCEVGELISIKAPATDDENIFSPVAPVTQLSADVENRNTAEKSDNDFKTLSDDSKLNEDVDDIGVEANPDSSKTSTSNDCIDPTIPIPADTVATTRPALNGQHDMEVDDLVCQEDESAFDYPIPIHQTNRLHEPSAPILHCKEEMEPSHKVSLTTALRPSKDVPVAPVNSKSASEGIEDATTTRIVPVASDLPEPIVLEKKEVFQTIVHIGEVVKEQHMLSSIEPNKGLNEPKVSGAIEDNPTLCTDRIGSNGAPSNLETADTAAQTAVMKVDSDVTEKNAAVELVPVNSEQLPDNSTSVSSDRIKVGISDDPLNKMKLSDDRTTTKRVLDHGPFASKKKIRALPGQSGDMDIIRVKRPNLTKLKQLLYTAGKRVHGQSIINYDKLFGDYWFAFSRRIEGPMNKLELANVQSILHSFLKSASLRKLHNQLILGLMKRCLDTKALLSDISSAVPRPLRERMNIKSTRSSMLKRREIEDTLSHTDSEHQPKCKKLRTTHPSYYPTILEPISEIEQSTVIRPEMESMRIPGSLIIDPQVRKIAESHGLKVTEHAVWLLTVAVKEFAMSFISKSLTTKEAVTLGRVPPHLTRQFLVPDKLSYEKSIETSKAGTSLHRKKYINSSDLHTVIANLPISSRSLSGSVSRTLFERSLGSAIDSSLVFGGSAFDALKKHIIKKVTPLESKGPRSDDLTVPPTHGVHQGNVPSSHDNLTDRMTHPVRGLGRGAKDLAALKARASNITSRTSSQDASALNEPIAKPAYPQNASALAAPKADKATSEAKNIQASPIGHRSVPLKTNIAFQNEDVSVKIQPEADILERVSGSSETSDAKSLSQGSRRGKGHGVKNLAAMRARSVTSSSDLADDLAEAAAADTIEAPARDDLSNSIDSNLPSTIANDEDANLNGPTEAVNTNLNDLVAVVELKFVETPNMKPTHQPAINESLFTVEPLPVVATLPPPSVANEGVPREHTAPTVDSGTANEAKSFEASALKKSLEPTIADTTITISFLSTDASTNITAHEATAPVDSKDASPKDELCIKIESNLDTSERDSVQTDGDLQEPEKAVRAVMQPTKADFTENVDGTISSSVSKGSEAPNNANDGKPG